MAKHPPPPVRPPTPMHGGFGFTELARYLRCSKARLKGVMDELGIERRPYVRDDGVVKKTYKRGYAPLSENEVERVIAYLRQQQGQAILRRKRRDEP